MHAHHVCTPCMHTMHIRHAWTPCMFPMRARMHRCSDDGYVQNAHSGGSTPAPRSSGCPKVRHRDGLTIVYVLSLSCMPAVGMDGPIASTARHSSDRCRVETDGRTQASNLAPSPPVEVERREPCVQLGLRRRPAKQLPQHVPEARPQHVRRAVHLERPGDGRVAEKVLVESVQVVVVAEFVENIALRPCRLVAHWVGVAQRRHAEKVHGRHGGRLPGSSRCVEAECPYKRV
eukprot:353336-Chlamydomonas_euryale.AAC.7